MPANTKQIVINNSTNSLFIALTSWLIDAMSLVATKFYVKIIPPVFFKTTYRCKDAVTYLKDKPVGPIHLNKLQAPTVYQVTGLS
jgi:hypothetical protein